MRRLQQGKRIVSWTWLTDSITAREQLPFTEKYVIHAPSPLDHLESVHEEREGRTSASPASSVVESIAAISEPENPKSNDSLDSPIYPTQETSTWKTERIAPPKWENKRFA